MPHALHPNLAHLLWDGAEAHPHRTAVESRDAEVDYAALRTRAAGIASGLRERGISPGDRVGILLDRGAEAISAFFGVLAAGAVAVNIGETLRPRQIEHFLSRAGASVLISSPELLGTHPRPIETSAGVVPVAELPRSADFDPVARIGDDVAQITFTSGSTGQPKGVTLSHGNLWSVTHAVVQYLGLCAQDRIASLLPFSFVYGLNQVLCMAGSGARLVIERSPLPQQIAASLRARQITVLAGVPPLWGQLLGQTGFRDEPLPSLRVMTNAGGRLNPELVRGLRRAQPQARLFLMYGLSEALRSTYLDPDEVDRRPDSIGRAIPGAEIHVLRDDLTVCAPGEVGELVQRGPTVALGYWDDPEATGKTFRPNPLLAPGVPPRERVVFSGDLVRRDEEGFLYYVSRRDRLIKSLGYRVSPDEICDVVYASRQVAEAVVTSVPDAQRGERIVAVVVLAPDGTVEALQSFCGLELPRYMQPTQFELRDSLPRLPSGKFDVQAVKAGLAG
ncbi:MAG TPA: AMP-binding protein [Gemmatimonadaceae bacterium]|nr:AMP-binding protein [Gemmatimonadaceae bacterium]